VLLGSDFPFDMGVMDPVDRVRSAGLSGDDCDAICGGNAAALLGL
jgi:aminocarboxymuconate-semialdehyde decarboxylase